MSDIRVGGLQRPCDLRCCTLSGDLLQGLWTLVDRCRNKDCMLPSRMVEEPFQHFHTLPPSVESYSACPICSQEECVRDHVVWHSSRQGLLMVCAGACRADGKRSDFRGSQESLPPPQYNETVPGNKVFT